ncbi:MAG: alpha/beta hydrolase [Tepidiformaceae bacterium]
MSSVGTVLQQEAKAGAEYAALLGNPVYHGVGIPRGHGESVLVLPGLFGNDLYLLPLLDWLRRIGYRPIASHLAFNAGCPNRLVDEVAAMLANRLGAEERLSIVGHSRGGMLGWALASRMGSRVSQLVLLGSPASGLVQLARSGKSLSAASSLGHERVGNASNNARRLLDPDCSFPACGCSYLEDLRRPLNARTLVTSIFSTEDQIVAPRACPVAGATNVKVLGSHSGLVWNVAVYRQLAESLAAS